MKIVDGRIQDIYLRQIELLTLEYADTYAYRSVPPQTTNIYMNYIYNLHSQQTETDNNI
jgi:hypothetical protein